MSSIGGLRGWGWVWVSSWDWAWAWSWSWNYIDYASDSETLTKRLT